MTAMLYENEDDDEKTAALYENYATVWRLNDSCAVRKP